MRSLSIVALLALSAQAAVSQQTPVAGRTTTLTLEEAHFDRAEKQPCAPPVQNNVRTQDAQVRDGVWPAVADSGRQSSQHVQPGRNAVCQRRGPAWRKRRLLPVGLQSLGLNYNLNASAAFAPRAAKAFRTAAEADVTTTAENIRALS